MKAYWLDQKEARIDAFELGQQGVLNQKLSVDPILYQEPLDALKESQGYGTQDQISLGPEMPNLDEICAKFVDEHYHDEDEVRFVLAGSGIFDIRSKDDRWMRIEVSQGDLIVVPNKRYHRFFLGEERAIHCVRLFQDASGWVPHYRSKAPA